MQIVLPYTYTAQVVPPRCRKPRPERMTEKITVTVREVTAAEAPVAIIGRGQRLGAKRHVHYATEYRWFGKKLYVRERIQRYSHGPIRTQSAAQFVKDPYPFKYEKNDDHGYNTRAEVRAEILGWARELLFIDGERWTVIDEPRYEILTFGLGHNHGIGWGTTLGGRNHFNQNVSRDRYFRCDQYEQAVAEATRIATARGDTKALPIAKQRPTRYEILIPEAVRLNTRKHGKGCAFINSIESMIEATSSPVAAAVGAVAILAKSI